MAIKLGLVKGYAGPQEGGGSDFLPFEGYVKATCVSVVKGKGQQPPFDGNFAFTLSALDDDCAGATLKVWAPYEGEEKNGTSKARHFLDALVSHGLMSAEDIAAAAEAEQEMDEDEYAKACVGETCYLRVTADWDEKNGKESTKANFSTQAKYEEAKSMPGAFRKPRPKVGPGAGPTAPVGGKPMGDVGGRPKGLGKPSANGAAATTPAETSPAPAAGGLLGKLAASKKGLPKVS